MNLHTKTIQPGILSAVPSITEIVHDISLRNRLDGDDDGRVVEVVPQSRVGCRGPRVEVYGGVRSRWHQDRIDAIVAEELEVFSSCVLAADVELEETTQVGARHGQKSERLEGGDLGLACASEELAVVLEGFNVSLSFD